jgi:hypothetical protein
MADRVSQVVAEVLRSSAVVSGVYATATTTVTFTPTASLALPIRNVIATTSLMFSDSGHGGGDCQVNAATVVQMSHGNALANQFLAATASTAMTFTLDARRGRVLLGSATTSLAFAQFASPSSNTGPTSYQVSAATSLAFVISADRGAARTYALNALTTVTVVGLADSILYALRRVSATTNVLLSGVVAKQWSGFASASTAVTIGQVALAPRDIFVSATTSLAMSDSHTNNQFFYKASNVTVTIGGIASSIVTGVLSGSGLVFSDHADSVVLLPQGGGVPGGANAGMRQVLRPQSGRFPNSYAETPSGLLIIANGIDPMLRWDGVSGRADTAGVIAPLVGIEFGGTGVGRIVGRRVAFVRFLDAAGNTSNLSPVSNDVDFGTDGLIDLVSYSSAGVVTVKSFDHGRSIGDVIIIEGVEGLELANGQWTITVVDADNFTINGLVITAGRYKQCGRWVYGIATVLYGSVPVPTESKVVRRQILRNLAGNSETFYVDIDTDDLTSSAFTSTVDDATLSAGIPVPIGTSEDTPWANRYYPPPSHKAIVAAHLGRIFAAGEVSYEDGNCQPRFGLNTIQGTGTNWQKSFKDRVIYMAGASKTYEIAAVNEDTQEITTTQTITDALGPFTSYAIRPPIAERRFVYYSEPALPEAWPPWNAISLPEDGDEITGLMVMRSFIYVLEKRHIYKFTFQVDPSRDGFVFPTTRRGCINNRCWVIVEDVAYMLDEVGLLKFSGQESEPISTPIQTLFQQVGLGGLEVNWNADQRYWHAAHDPVRDTIRWFLSMSGATFPRHAICYDYRRERLWIEEYPFPVSSSTIGTVGYRRSVAGSEARRVLVLGEGSLDTIDTGNALRGTVSSAGPHSLTDSSTSFPPNLAGAPVSIADGRGVSQQRRIVSNTATTLVFDRPWIVRPDDTSTYQVGGVNWIWQSGWFRYVDEEQSNTRDTEVIFQPLKAATSANMRLYFDHSTTPESWDRTIEQDGVRTISGTPEVTMDLTYKAGFAAHRHHGHRDPLTQGTRYVSVELSGVQGAEIHRLYQITMNGAHQA